MADIGFNDIQAAVFHARRQARRSEHIEQARYMLMAAMMASATIVVVAAVLLLRLF